MNTRNTRSSTSNVSLETPADSVKTVKNVASIGSIKSVDTKGKKCSSSHEDLSECENVTEGVGRRSSTRLAKAVNSKEIADNPSAVRPARSSRSQDPVSEMKVSLENISMTGRKRQLSGSSQSKETVVDTSPTPKLLRSRTRKTSEAESIESTSSVSTRRSSGRTRQVSETESIESISSNSGRRYSTRSRKADDFDDCIETPVYTGRRSSSRLSQASGMGSTENLTATEKTSNVAHVSIRLSKIEERIESEENNLNVRMKVKGEKHKDDSNKDGEIEKPMYTGRRSSSRLSQVSGMGSTENLTAAEKNNTTHVGACLSRIEECVELEENNLNVRKKVKDKIDTDNSNKMLPAEEMSSASVLLQPYVSSSGTAKVLDIESSENRRSSRLKKDSVLVEDKEVCDEPVTPRKRSARLLKESQSTDSKGRFVKNQNYPVIAVIDLVKNEEGIRRKVNSRTSAAFDSLSVEVGEQGDKKEMREDESVPTSQNTKENERNLENHSSPIVEAAPSESATSSADKRAKVTTPECLNDSSSFSQSPSKKTLKNADEIIQQAIVIKNTPDSGSTTSSNVEGRSIKRENSLINDSVQDGESQSSKVSESPTHAPGTVKSNSPQCSDVSTSWPVVKLVDCQQEQVPDSNLFSSDGNSLHHLTVNESNSEEAKLSKMMSNTLSPKIISNLPSYSEIEADDTKTEHLSEQKLKKHSPAKQESNNSAGILPLTDGNTEYCLATAQSKSQFKENNVNCQTVSEKTSAKHQIKAAYEADSLCQTKIESPQKRSGQNAVFEIQTSNSAKEQDVILERTSIDSDRLIIDENRGNYESKVLKGCKPLGSSEKESNDSSSADALAQKVRESVSTEGVEKSGSLLIEQDEEDHVTKRNEKKPQGAVQKDEGFEVSKESEEDPLEDSDLDNFKLSNLSDSDDDNVVVDNHSDESIESSDTIRCTGSTSETTSEGNRIKNNSKSPSPKSVISEKSSNVLIEEVFDRGDLEKTKDFYNSSELSDSTELKRSNSDSVDTSSKTHEGHVSGSISFVDPSEKETLMNKEQSTGVEKKDQAKKHVTWDKMAKPQVKCTSKPSSVDLNDPEYVLKINNYINDVLSNRQKSNEIAKIVKNSASKIYKKNIIQKNNLNPIKISSEQGERENKKNAANTNNEVSESSLKKCKVGTKDETVQNKIKSRDPDFSQKSQLCTIKDGISGPVSTKKKNSPTTLYLNSVKEKSSAQVLKKEPPVKRKFKEEVTVEEQSKQFEKRLSAKTLNVPESSKKFKSKQTSNNLECHDPNIPFNKTFQKTEINVTENGSAATENLKKLHEKLDKNCKTSSPAKSIEVQSKEDKGSLKAGMLLTNWGRISVDSNPRKIGTVGKRKIVDPANKWQIKSAPVNSFGAVQVTAGKKLKTSSTFIVTPNASKTNFSLVHNSNNKSNVLSTSQKTEECKNISTNFCQFPKAPHPTQPKFTSVQLSAHDLKLKPSTEFNSIKKKKNKGLTFKSHKTEKTESTVTNSTVNQFPKESQTQQNVLITKPSVQDSKLRPSVETHRIQRKKKKNKKKDLIFKFHKTEESRNSSESPNISQFSNLVRPIQQCVTSNKSSVLDSKSKVDMEVSSTQKKKKKNKNFMFKSDKTKEPEDSSSVCGINQFPKNSYQKQLSGKSIKVPEHDLKSKPLLEVNIPKKNKNENFIPKSFTAEESENTYKSLNISQFPKESHQTELSCISIKQPIGDSKWKADLEANGVQKKKNKKKKKKASFIESCSSVNLMKALVSNYSDRRKLSDVSRKSFFKFSDSVAPPSSKMEAHRCFGAEAMGNEKKVVSVKNQVNDFKLLSKARKLDVKDVFYKNKTFASSS